MCKICKTCNQSNFGVIVKKTEERAGRMLNGEITEYFEGSEETQEKILINYCFTCGREITENELSQIYVCKACKSEVEQINENGVCMDCAKEVDKLSEASREELILMILKQNKKITGKLPILPELHKSFQSAEVNKEKLENKEDKNKEKLVKNNKKSDTIKKRSRVARNIDCSKVEIDTGKKVSSRRKKKCEAIDNTNYIKKEKKEAALTSQENMDKAINDNKGKIKAVPRIKSVDSKSSEYVADKVSGGIQEVKDIAIDLNIKDNINIYNENIETIDSDIVHKTLMEIEDIMNDVNNKNCEML